MAQRILTCVYCGHEYPQQTPAWNDEVLTEHIRECPKHPMRKAEKKITELRETLAALRKAAKNVCKGNDLFGYPSPADMQTLSELCQRNGDAGDGVKGGQL